MEGGSRLELKSNSQNQKTISLNDYATAASIDYNSLFCPHKLPCGYCSLMSRPCIKDDYSITWDTVTNPLTTRTTTTTNTAEGE